MLRLTPLRPDHPYLRSPGRASSRQPPLLHCRRASGKPHTASSVRCDGGANVQQASWPTAARSTLPGSWRGRHQQQARRVAAASDGASMRQGNDVPPAGSADSRSSSNDSGSNGGNGGSNVGSSRSDSEGGGRSAGNGGNGSSRPGSSWPGGGSDDGPFERMSQPLLVALAALSGVLLVAVGRLLLAASAEDQRLDALERRAACSAEAASISEHIAALKRLLREVFAEQLGARGRLQALEKAAATQLEAADDFALQRAGGGSSSSSSWKRTPVRFSGFLSAAGVLPWSQEADSSAALAMLSALGAGGQADGRLQLHSVLAGGKRRITAELAPAEAAGAAAAGAPALQLQRLLYRVEVRPWLQLMIAPLGGSLAAVAKSITPVAGDFGCSHTLRQGHGLTALSSTGSGKAVSCSRGRLSAAAGFFVGGHTKSTVAQLQLRGNEGHALSLVAASCRQSIALCSSSSGGGEQPPPAGLRFLGTQAPGCCHTNSGGQGGPASHCGRSSVVGLAGVLPLQDALTATAWAERPSAGAAGWGLGLYSQPDRHGVELGMVLARPSAQHAAFRDPAVPLFCELAAKLPVGDGLSIAPGGLVTFREGGASLAFCMGSSWRF